VDIAADDGIEPENALARTEAVRAAVSRFLELAPGAAQLRDPQGRARLLARRDRGDARAERAGGQSGAAPRTHAAARPSKASGPAAPPRAISPAVARYATLFNARDWDGVRAMLVDDVKLALVSRWQREGRREVSNYFTNYDKVRDRHLVPGWLDGREVLAVFRDPRDARPGYFMELALVDGQVASIRDFRYVPYIARDAAIDFPADRAKIDIG
jgi:hypothetical protein